MQFSEILFGLTALIFAGLVTFALTPIAQLLSYKFGAIDVPKDNRRMHTDSIPLLGGLAVFFAFAVTVLLFGELSPTLSAILIGGSVIVICGVLDDSFDLPPFVKLLFQIAAAGVAVLFGVRIDFLSFFGSQYLNFGAWNLLVTFGWIVILTNAFNLIDGLDGLACGVSAISSLSLLAIACVMSDSQIALITAILVGSCLGFLPFNFFPAKIFIGDTGAMFLGYTLSILSIQGLFKTHVIFAFLAPFAIFALPLFDTFFAFFRRLFAGKNPFKGDRGHIHHRLIDLGFSHKQSVCILYAVCGIFGASSVALVFLGLMKAFFVVGIGVLILGANYLIAEKHILRQEREAEKEKEKEASAKTDH